MIKILEKGQTTFTRTCDRCGCKFQYDLSDLCGFDFIPCPHCHTSLAHVGPKANKIDLNKTNKTDTNQINFDNIKTYTTPCKVEVGDGRYNYATTTGPQYINPNPTVTISKTGLPKLDSCTITGGDPNVTIYANNLPDDIVDDPYNKIGSNLPDDVRDDCMYRSEEFNEWYNNLMKIMKENKPVNCKNKN